MAVLQNCVGFVDGGTGSCSETCVTCDDDGTEEVSIKVEEAIDINDEMLETRSSSVINTENDVRICGVFEVVAAHAFGLFIAPKNCKIALIYSLFSVIF
jgi:hypothetical protein